MKTPPFLLAAALLFWGWQNGLLVYAVVAAVLLEAPRVVQWRWEFSANDLVRICDFCVVVFVGALVLFYFMGQLNDDAIRYARWLPLVALPLVLAQAYSVKNHVTLRTFFWLLRRRKIESAVNPLERTIPLGYPFVALCLVAASVANVRDFRFYLGLSLLVAWVLWMVRVRTASKLAWCAALGVVIALGYAGHLALHRLHLLLERRYVDWLAGYQHETDFNETTTALGQIGTLKLSGQIVLRLEPGENRQAPGLLRETSYNAFRPDRDNSRWVALGIRKRDQGVASEASRTRWFLLPDKPPEQRVTISTYLKRGAGILALPNGTCRIENLVALSMIRHSLGGVKVEDATEFVRFRAGYGPGPTIDGPPAEMDRTVPPQEDPVLETIITELGLRSQPPAQVLDTLQAYFSKNFTYSRYLSANRPEQWGRNTPIGYFLTRSRAGHCEYFATATVLLLRKAGIPARYATGYAVQEYHPRSGLYLVRERHAHAWTLVCIDGIWRDFDTTPATWTDLEAENGSLWQGMTDFWSQFRYRLAKWRLEGGTKGLTRVPSWLVLTAAAAGIAFLIWRRRRQTTRAQGRPASHAGAHPGEDSAFYQVEKRLDELGYPRRTGETLADWIGRLEASPGGLPGRTEIDSLVALHYRYRFDPDGLNATEQEALRADATRWLEKFA